MLRDVKDTREVAQELLDIIDDLRPEPRARIISRRKLELMAAMINDQDLIDLLTNTDHMSLFWEYPDGRIEQQKITVELVLVSI